MISEAARNAQVLDHLGLVRAIAVHVAQNLSFNLEIDDLVSAGTIGLFDAAEKYQPKRKVAFSTYAGYRIRGAILDSLRELDYASRNMRRRQKQVDAVRGELEITLGHSPREEDVAERLGLSLARWHRVLRDLPRVRISASTRPDEDLPAPDFEDAPQAWPDWLRESGELAEFMEAALESLPPRCRYVMVLYYRDGARMKRIGELIGVNESRISQIHTDSLKRMKKFLEKRGIASSAAFLRAAA